MTKAEAAAVALPEDDDAEGIGEDEPANDFEDVAKDMADALGLQGVDLKALGLALQRFCELCTGGGEDEEPDSRRY